LGRETEITRGVRLTGAVDDEGPASADRGPPTIV
jgi:hypothetical protein